MIAQHRGASLGNDLSLVFHLPPDSSVTRKNGVGFIFFPLINRANAIFHQARSIGTCSHSLGRSERFNPAFVHPAAQQRGCTRRGMLFGQPLAQPGAYFAETQVTSHGV